MAALHEIKATAQVCTRSSFSKSFLLAAAAMVFAAGASAQSMDTAYVPFRVNVNATATAQLAGGVKFEKLVRAGSTDTLHIISESTTPVSMGKTPKPVAMHSSRGKISLELSRQLYKGVDIALYSLNGKQIMHAKADASETLKSISHPNVRMGVYVLSVKGVGGSIFTTRLTHSGGGMNIDVSFANEKFSSGSLMEKALPGNWTITVSAEGHLDTSYAFVPEAGRGNTPVQNITLRQSSSPSSSSVEDEPSSSSSAVVSSSSAVAVVSSSSSAVAVVSSSSSTEGEPSSSSSAPPSSSSVTPVTLACGTVPASGISDVAIAPPALTCSSGETATDISWSGAPVWSNPERGIYSNISATATCGTSSDLTASCSGSLQVYKTVVIGSQTWMAENLNYNPGTGNSACYNNQTSNCAIYGRLYDWATAMGLPSSCTSSCSSQIQSKHRGICPSGWHIPSNNDWNVLMDYVGGSSTAGRYLKSTSGWNSNNGTNDYGFSALPGGFGSSGGSFYDVGNVGFWWSARENEINSSYAYSRRMDYYSENADWSNSIKFYLSSVRCLQDPSSSSAAEDPSSSSAAEDPSSSSAAEDPSSSSAAEDPSSSSAAEEYVDSRDNKKYKAVTIGTQTWMAENLNYAASGSKCYNDLESNCDTYGRLYDWSTAMRFSSSCNSSSCSSQVQQEHQGICPSGWHIPSDAEWTTLTDYVGGSSTAGTKLKANSEWNSSGNGTNDYGFSALPGGLGINGGFGSVGDQGYWLSATEYDANLVYTRRMNYSDSVFRNYGFKAHLSVRCVLDTSFEYLSSSSAAEEYVDSRDNKKYKAVTIGTQIWMTENLNYNPDTGNSACYDNQTSNCNTYGRLYDWPTAMNLPSSCNSSFCSNQIQYKHRGICPSGWHIPSDNDWNVLIDYVGDSSTAGRYLKSTSGWNSSYNGTSGNGTNDYGFSALPGGGGYSDGGFGNVGYYGRWWSAIESEYGNNNAYSRNIYHYGEHASWSNYDKSILFSVRCLLDNCSVNNNTSTHYCSDGTMKGYVFLTDSRDNKKYKAVTIGTQIWMAENLNYNPDTGNSACYDNQTSNCATYGRLYDWSTAMNLVSSCNSSFCSSQIQSKHRGICPSGWHIPSDAEWTTLTDYVGSSTAGTKLKANSGWKSNGNGTNDYGFSALPGGAGNSVGFGNIGESGFWFSASEYEDSGYAAYSRHMYDYIEDAARYGYGKSAMFSVRCLQDNCSENNNTSTHYCSDGTMKEYVFLTDSRDNKKYKVFTIGTQTWMAENLNYDTTSSKCYNNLESNCNTYGRLYDWSTAMNLVSSCNSSSCSNQIQQKHQGICPSGWHIPSDAEWITLTNYVGSSTAGTKLKANSGWNSSGNGTNDYGFSALPGGLGYSNGSFGSVGDFGNWWGASEHENISESAYRRYVYYDSEGAGWSYYSKSDLFSVRCLQD